MLWRAIIRLVAPRTPQRRRLPTTSTWFFPVRVLNWCDVGYLPVEKDSEENNEKEKQIERHGGFCEVKKSAHTTRSPSRFKITSRHGSSKELRRCIDDAGVRLPRPSLLSKDCPACCHNLMDVMHHTLDVLVQKHGYNDTHYRQGDDPESEKG